MTEKGGSEYIPEGYQQPGPPSLGFCGSGPFNCPVHAPATRPHTGLLGLDPALFFRCTLGDECR